MTASLPNSISVVTVTYGDRLALLEKVISQCLTHPAVGDVHVVSNNSKSDFTALRTRWGDKVKLIELAENRGSAAGFSVGITSALAGGRPYLLLLDDDNAPKAGCIGRLLEELHRATLQLGPEKCAVVAARDLQHQQLLNGLSPEFVYPRPSSFVGFSLGHFLRRKVMRLLSCDRMAAGTASITVPNGPYGGLMAARILFEAIGLPEERLVLYSDDIEYTDRISQRGGQLRLVLDARIEDLDGRHSEKLDEKTVFLSLLKAPSQFRLYYSIRNTVWFEFHRRSRFRPFYRINQRIFLFFMARAARRAGEPLNYEVFLKAVRDGEADRLGHNDRFLLPS